MVLGCWGASEQGADGDGALWNEYAPTIAAWRGMTARSQTIFLASPSVFFRLCLYRLIRVNHRIAVLPNNFILRGVELDAGGHLARLNLEDDIFSSPAFHDLCEHFKGDTAKALGELALFWFAAQRRWVRGELLPLKEFKEKWRIFLDVGIAEQREDGIYSCGAEEQFAWLRQKRNAGREGGIRSGESRRKAPKRREAARSGSKREGTGVEAAPSGSKPLTLSLTLNTERSSYEDLSVASVPVATGRVEKGKTLGRQVAEFIARYVEAFERRYGTRPIVDGLAAGEAKRVVQGLGYPRCLDAADAYVQTENPRYLSKCHDLTTLRMDLTRIAVALAQGVENPNENFSWEKWKRAFMQDEPEKIEGGQNGKE